MGRSSKTKTCPEIINPTEEVEYMIQKNREPQKLTPMEETKIHCLKVKLIHPVLPQHTLEHGAGSRAPTKEIKKKFEEYAPLRSGKYTPEEDNIILNNWKNFCEVHNWDKAKVEPFMNLRDDNHKFSCINKINRKKIFQFLATNLPNRTIYSIYHRFRCLLSTYKEDRYSNYEDNLILKWIEENPHVNERRRFGYLAKALNRTRTSVYRRYRRLTAKSEKSEEDD